MHHCPSPLACHCQTSRRLLLAYESGSLNEPCLTLLLFRTPGSPARAFTEPSQGCHWAQPGLSLSYCCTVTPGLEQWLRQLNLKLKLNDVWIYFRDLWSGDSCHDSSSRYHSLQLISSIQELVTHWQSLFTWLSTQYGPRPPTGSCTSLATWMFCRSTHNTTSYLGKQLTWQMFDLLCRCTTYSKEHIHIRTHSYTFVQIRTHSYTFVLTKNHVRIVRIRTYVYEYVRMSRQKTCVFTSFYIRTHSYTFIQHSYRIRTHSYRIRTIFVHAYTHVFRRHVRMLYECVRML